VVAYSCIIYIYSLNIPFNKIDKNKNWERERREKNMPEGVKKKKKLGVLDTAYNIT
jgi:hypothetical protein